MLDICKSPEHAAVYLAALIDGEGCVGTYSWVGRSGARVRRRVVTVSVKDKELIDAAARCCRLLGIPFSQRTAKPRADRAYPMHLLDITTYAGIARFAALVPLQHAGKAERIHQVLAAFKTQTCSGCGCAWDARTPGCARCQDRHKMRRRSERAGSARKEAVSGKPGRPRGRQKMPIAEPHQHGGVSVCWCSDPLAPVAAAVEALDV